MPTTKQNVTVNSGTGFTGLLTLVFIVLKLCKVIDWSWLWVLSPLLIGVGLVLLILIVLLVLYLFFNK